MYSTWMEVMTTVKGCLLRSLLFSYLELVEQKTLGEQSLSSFLCSLAHQLMSLLRLQDLLQTSLDTKEQGKEAWRL